MDAERLREGLNDLLKLADYVVCAARFPQACVLFSLELYIVRMCNIEVSHPMNLVFDINKWIDLNRLPFYYTCLSVNMFFSEENIKSLLASEENILSHLSGLLKLNCVNLSICSCTSCVFFDCILSFKRHCTCVMYLSLLTGLDRGINNSQSTCLYAFKVAQHQICDCNSGKRWVHNAWEMCQWYIFPFLPVPIDIYFLILYWGWSDRMLAVDRISCLNCMCIVCCICF